MATKIALIITKLELGGAQKSVLYTARHISDNFEPFLLCGPGGYLDKYAKDHIKNLYFIKVNILAIFQLYSIHYSNMTLFCQFLNLN